MKTLWISFRFFLISAVGLGFLYPLMVWGMGQLLFPFQSNGSLITGLGSPSPVGSLLIGQDFPTLKYLQGRPSVANPKLPFDGMTSGGSNLSPAGDGLRKILQDRVAYWVKLRPGIPIPGELISASASSLDPEISPASAFYQAPLVAQARGISESQVRALIEAHTRSPFPGLPGEPGVNLLLTNLALDQAFGK